VAKYEFGLLAFNHAYDVFFAHLQQFDTTHLEGLAGILAEQHLVADFDFQRAHFAIVAHFAFTDGNDFTLIRFFRSRAGDNDTGSGLLFGFQAFDDNAVI